MDKAFALLIDILKGEVCAKSSPLAPLSLDEAKELYLFANGRLVLAEGSGDGSFSGTIADTGLNDPAFVQCHSLVFVIRHKSEPPFAHLCGMMLLWHRKEGMWSAWFMVFGRGGSHQAEREMPTPAFQGLFGNDGGGTSAFNTF